jgi:hypothetical protein
MKDTGKAVNRITNQYPEYCLLQATLLNLFINLNIMSDKRFTCEKTSDLVTRFKGQHDSYEL